ncbi:MAG: hypothetical protein IPH75_08010 [bacterium]|nr:hypothetical protein [bacterium]
MSLYLIVIEMNFDFHLVIMEDDGDRTMLFETQALAEAYAAEHLQSDYKVFEW